MSIDGEIVEESVVDQGAPAASNAVNPITQPETQIDEPAEKPEAKEDKPEDPPIPKGVQKRIDRAVRQKYEAEARTKMLEERLNQLEQQSRQQVPQKAIDNSEPKIENFDNFDEYVAAKAAYIAEQKINKTLAEREERERAERQQYERQKVQTSWQQRVAEATAEMPDFEDVIASSEVPMTEPMQQAIMESDVGPKLAYYLANNPDEATKIAGMSPIGAIRALGRIEERLQAQPVKKPTAAPEPIKPVGAKASVAKDPGKMTDAEYAKWRKLGKAA